MSCLGRRRDEMAARCTDALVCVLENIIGKKRHVVHTNGSLYRLIDGYSMLWGDKSFASLMHLLYAKLNGIQKITCKCSQRYMFV